MTELCGDIKTNIPSQLTEDFTNDNIGHSWLHPTKYTTQPLPLLEHLLANSSTAPARVDPSGLLQWVPSRVAKYRRLFDDINELLSVLCFIIPAPPPRGTEYMDTRISNGQISRNVFKNFGTWFVHRMVKTTTLTGSLSWIPVLCPDKLGSLVDRYLLLVRPVECIFTEVLSGRESLEIYKEFLWVQNGNRVTSPMFSQILGVKTRDYMGATLTLRPWRHIAISIMREFIPAHSGGNQIGDLLSNHSTHQAQKTYAREVTQLPFLTSDVLLQSRELCSTWHDVLGFGRNPSPIPMRLLSYGGQPIRSSSNPTPAQTSSATLERDALQRNISEIVKAAVQMGNQDLKVEMSSLIEKAVARGVASYLTKLGSKNRTEGRMPLTSNSLIPAQLPSASANSLVPSTSSDAPSANSLDPSTSSDDHPSSVPLEHRTNSDSAARRISARDSIHSSVIPETPPQRGSHRVLSSSIKPVDTGNASKTFNHYFMATTSSVTTASTSAKTRSQIVSSTQVEDSVNLSDRSTAGPPNQLEIGSDSHPNQSDPNYTGATSDGKWIQ